MRSLFFSIIIPTRKLNNYLTRETLPAIAKLKYKNFEVILLPDSTNGFSAETKKYKWLKIIKNKSMPGIKRDAGVAKSKGNIVVFIDDDAYPPNEWLTVLNKIYQSKKNIVAVGGPGILPENVNTWEKIFDVVMQSFIGTGGFSYRFIKGKKQFVEDFPSMNLSFRKNIFIKLGGFKNKYWPGEDSKLINALINKEKKLIYYDPKTYIFHHRRDTLTGYLKQHRNYGFMRGMFFAHGDKNSKAVAYKIPSIFTVYVFVVALISAASIIYPINETVIRMSLVPLIVYGLLILFAGSLTFLKTFDSILTLGTILVLPLTHVTYGISFIKGYLYGRTS
jgi:cellulose synthase/poly-beta-1,6-N-acetylglucosamine synthase-like glycosyltransferase